MRKSVTLFVALVAVCAAIVGDSSGAATSYPSPLRLQSTPSSVAGSWTLGTTVNTPDATTATRSVDNAVDGAWYTFAPGATTTAQQASLPAAPSGTGWIVDPAGGASGFPAGNWTFTAETFVPGATLTPGAAVLTVGMWKGTVSGGVFTPTATLLAPADDPLAQDLRSDFLVTTSVAYAVPKFSLAAGETLYVELWRHQVAGISDATDANRELDLVVNDGNSRITHPSADDVGPTHDISVTPVSGSAVFDAGTGTLYYNGSEDGSFEVGDTLADSGSLPLQVTYPAVLTPGWTHAAETVTSGGDFTSSSFDWTAGSTTSPGALTITGEDNAYQTSTATLTVTNDTTGPTGQTVAVTGGPNFATETVPLTVDDGTDAGVGVDSLSGIVERADGTPANGTCGGFGAFTPVVLSGTDDTDVVDGGCYRYRYLVSDLLGNETASANSVDSIVDSTSPTVVDSAPTESSGDVYWASSTDTLFFRPAGAASFTLNATPTDAQSGIASVAFPDVSATTGWTGSTGGTDTASEFSSPTAYTFTAGAAAPGAKTVTATNGTGLTGTDTITFTADSTAPTGQTVTLSGGPWFTTASVPLTLAVGTDAGAGVDSSRTVVERASATLTNGTCGTFGSFAAATLSGSTDAGATSGNCYRYQSKATDNVGNVSAVSAVSGDAKVDATPPTTPTLLFTGLANAAATGSTVYYKPTASGSFTLTAASSDPDSGVSTYTFPTVSGFTATGTGASRTYSFANSPSAPLAPLTVTSTSGSGQTSAGASFSLVPDPTAPTVTVLCNDKPCLTSAYAKAVTVTVTATDGTGSGLDTIRYTTDGSAPTVDEGTEYTKAITVTTLAHLKVAAFDKAGNASTPVTLTVNSIADRLTFAAPVRVNVKSKARYLQARVSANKRAAVSAVMSGKGLKKAERWRFTLASGSSIVQLRLPKAIKRPGTYKVVWTVTAGSKRMTKTSVVVLHR